MRNDYQPESDVLTAVGPVSVQTPKMRVHASDGECYLSGQLPPYLKKAKRLAAVIPWLYLKGDD